MSRREKVCEAKLKNLSKGSWLHINNKGGATVVPLCFYQEKGDVYGRVYDNSGSFQKVGDRRTAD